jgi:hypothetical protein
VTTNTAAGPVGLLDRGTREDPNSHTTWTKPRGPVNTIVQSRIRYHAPTHDYVARRTTEGKTSREIKRCLTRYIARDLYRLLESGPTRT